MKNLVMCVLLASSASFAQPIQRQFCAVVLDVRDLEGAPLDGISVSLQNLSGVTVQHATTRQGIARFCDFGFGTFSITVNGDDCGSIVLRGIKLSFGKQQNFTVVVNRCANEGDFGPGA